MRGAGAVRALAALVLTLGPASGSGQEPGPGPVPGPEAADTVAGLPADRIRRIEGPVGALRIFDSGPPGDGDAARTSVVLIPSLAGTLGQWRAQIERLRGERRVVALELRGHGGSAAPERPDYTLPALSRDVEAAVDSLGLGRFVLVGHSLGGGVAATYAGLHPDRVAGVLFVDPVGDQRQARSEMVEFLFALDHEYRPTVEAFWTSILEGARASTRARVMEDLRGTPKETVVRALEGLLYFDPPAVLQPYDGPMLSVVTPANDSGMALHRVVVGIDRAVMEGVSHWLHMDAPEEFGRHLDAFLERVEE